MQAPAKTVSRRLASLCALPLAVGFLCANSGVAQSQSFPHGTVRLAAENSSVQAAHDFTLALHFSLEDGWHTYWVNPGDSGEAPRVTWALPSGITAGSIAWPAPEKLGTSSIVDYGYQREVTLLVPMHAAATVTAQKPLTIGANVRVLVCKDVCIPGKTQVTLTLPLTPQTPPRDPAERELFAAARARLPRGVPLGWRLTARQEKDSFVLSALTGKRVVQAYFYPLEDSQIQNAAPQVIVPAPTGFALALRKSEQLVKPVARLKGVLVLSGDRAYFLDVPVSPAGKGAYNRSRKVVSASDRLRSRHKEVMANETTQFSNLHPGCGAAGDSAASSSGESRRLGAQLLRNR
jgi:DsbC/DsbD-like thiol-disulfide interchange protein